MRFRTYALSCALVGCSQSSATSHPPAATGIADAGGPVESGAGDAGVPDAGPCTSPDFSGSPFRVRCNQLVDAQGRTVLIHGMNARVPFSLRQLVHGQSPGPRADPRLRSGRRCTHARARVQHAAPPDQLESAASRPRAGGIASSYLDAVAAITAFCATAGVNVLIDLHQDDYSKEIGEDGAPLWAIQPPPTQLIGGVVPSNATESAQGLNAFSTFFGATAQGQYLRDRYTSWASAVAQRFADDPAVVGFEALQRAVHDRRRASPALRRDGPRDAGRRRSSSSGSPTRFRSRAASRSWATAGRSARVRSTRSTSTTSARDGRRRRRLVQTLSNAQVGEKAQSWGAPLVVTEYGYDPSSAGFAPWIGGLEAATNLVNASEMFWLWKEESGGFWGLYDFDDAGTPTERTATVKTLTRARLEALAGTLLSVAYDPTAQEAGSRFPWKQRDHRAEHRLRRRRGEPPRLRSGPPRATA